MHFSKCLRTQIYRNINVYFDPQGCQTLLLKESEPLPFTNGSWNKDCSAWQDEIQKTLSQSMCNYRRYYIKDISNKISNFNYYRIFRFNIFSCFLSFLYYHFCKLHVKSFLKIRTLCSPIFMCQLITLNLCIAFKCRTLIWVYTSAFILHKIYPLLKMF